MLDHDFYLDIPPNVVFEQVLEKGKKTDIISARNLLYQAYEQSARIFDYVQQAMRDQYQSDPNNARPLITIAQHAAETLSVAHIFHDRYAEYRKANIKEYTGLSWVEFLNLPHDHCDFLIEYGTIERKKDDASQNPLMQATRDAFNQSSLLPQR